MGRKLFKSKTKSLWIEIEVYESKDGQIIVHGHDSGTVVREIKRSYDYEYYVTIEKQDKQLLLNQLGLETTEALLDWFEQHFSNDRAVSQIKKKLGELGIDYQFSTW
jgi:hypothetical protein